MSVINITLSKFDSDWDGGIKNAKKVSSSLSSASDTVLDVVNGLHRDIVYSRNINSDLRRVSRSINEIEDKITDIRNFLLNSAKQYLQAQEEIKRIHKEYNLPYKKSTWQKIKEGAINVGKAVVAVGASVAIAFIAFGAAKLALAGGITLGSVAAVTTFIYACNDVITTLFEQFNNNFNPLKGLAEIIFGKDIGSFVYNGINLVAIGYSAVTAFKSLLKAPSILSNIGNGVKSFFSQISGNLKNLGTSIKNTLVGVANSCKSWTSIQQNIINPLKNIGSVGYRAIKNFVKSPTIAIKSLIINTTNYITGVCTKVPSLDQIKTQYLKPLLQVGKTVSTNFTTHIKHNIGKYAIITDEFISNNTYASSTTILGTILSIVCPNIGNTAYSGLENAFEFLDNSFDLLGESGLVDENSILV